MLFSQIEKTFPVDGLSGGWPLCHITGEGALPAWFDVTDLAVASIGMAGRALSQLTKDQAPVRIDRRLASFWFASSLRPIGWETPPIWDAVAGDYLTSDGWIRLHTNASHHQKAAIAVLGVDVDRASVTQAVAGWRGDELEAAIVEAGGCAAVMRDLDAWATHPQGTAVAAEPLVIWQDHGRVEPRRQRKEDRRPLAGLRVLDLTRVLAGPAAGRFLAAFGAEVLRIDPPGWQEPAAVPEMTLGKRCASLDLRQSEDRSTFEQLLSGADILLHGYRAGALPGLGYSRTVRRSLNPRLIDVSLNAYGWSGPWSGRRGFDSLVQMSCGIADHGMKTAQADRPTPLPVQALDHATGYVMAAAVLHALRRLEEQGTVTSARLSLARTAHLLSPTKRTAFDEVLEPETAADLKSTIEKTDWGPARRLKFPLHIDNIEPSWRYPAGELRSSPPLWSSPPLKST